MSRVMRTPDPELLPIQRPRWPKCQMRMVTIAFAPDAKGFERRTFECLKCHHAETRLMVADPIKSSAVTGWVSGELGRSEQGN
jgi:hypothetical protein